MTTRTRAPYRPASRTHSVGPVRGALYRSAGWSTRSTPIHVRPSMWFVVTVWVTKHAFGLTSWTVRTASRSVRSHYARLSDAVARMREPLITDLTSGETHHARDFELSTSQGAGDIASQWQWAEKESAERDAKHSELNWIQAIFVHLRIIETRPVDVERDRYVRRRVQWYQDNPPPAGETPSFLPPDNASSVPSRPGGYRHIDDNAFERFIRWPYSLRDRIWYRIHDDGMGSSTATTRDDLAAPEFDGGYSDMPLDHVDTLPRRPRASGRNPRFNWVTESTGGPTMAEEINSFDDLYDPRIEVPLEYPERVPAQLSGAARLLDNYAADFDEVSAEETKKAEAIRRFRDYHEKARVSPAVLGDLEEAAEKADEVAALLKRAAALYGEVATALMSAARAADAEYSDHAPPRYDEANGA